MVSARQIGTTPLATSTDKGNAVSLPIIEPPDDEDDAKRAERREGRRRKLDGQAKRECAHFVDLRNARNFAIFLGKGKKKRLTTDDIRTELGIPNDKGSKWVPNIMGPLAKAGIFKKVGVIESGRKERRGGDLKIWEYTGNEEATNKWLIENPPLVAVAPGNPVAKHETPVAEQSTSTNLDSERDLAPSVNGPTDQTQIDDPSISSPRENDAVSDVTPTVNDPTSNPTVKQQRLFDELGGPNVV